MLHHTIRSTTIYDSWDKIMLWTNQPHSAFNHIEMVDSHKKEPVKAALNNIITQYAALWGTRAKGWGNSLVGLPKEKGCKKTWQQITCLGWCTDLEIKKQRSQLTSMALWKKCELVLQELQQHAHVLQLEQKPYHRLHRGNENNLVKMLKKSLETMRCWWVKHWEVGEGLTICRRICNYCLSSESCSSFHIRLYACRKKRLYNCLQLLSLFWYFWRPRRNETFISSHIYIQKYS